LKVREIRVLLGSFVVCWKIGFFFFCVCVLTNPESPV
jgi:hypothetical protein